MEADGPRFKAGRDDVRLQERFTNKRCRVRLTGFKLALRRGWQGRTGC